MSKIVAILFALIFAIPIALSFSSFVLKLKLQLWKQKAVQAGHFGDVVPDISFCTLVDEEFAQEQYSSCGKMV